jgi:hypothetical protein
MGLLQPIKIVARLPSPDPIFHAVNLLEKYNKARSPQSIYIKISGHRKYDRKTPKLVCGGYAYFLLSIGLPSSFSLLRATERSAAISLCYLPMCLQTYFYNPACGVILSPFTIFSFWYTTQLPELHLVSRP